MEIPIQTVVRVKPGLNPLGDECVQVDSFSNLVRIGNQCTFSANCVLPLESTQNTLYNNVIHPLIGNLLDGYDVSVVTTGARDTGKTYTILGPGLDCTFSESEHGIIPRFVREVFYKLVQHDRSYSVSITWSEIRGENICDLLGAGSVKCSTVADVFQCIHMGFANVSPDTHTLFTITIKQEYYVDMCVQHKISTASFTDLCGSKSVYVMDAYGENQILPVDSGLLALHSVVSALNEPFVNVYVPYSKSTLTTLLRDSFGGRAKTVVICCISPLTRVVNETLNSLQFLAKMQNITNTVTLNTFSTPLVEPSEPFDSEKDSVDRSTADLFGLQFAASQWMKLVSNAESLFIRLITDKNLLEKDKGQISEWLLLKQECDECLQNADEAASMGTAEPQRSLGRIDEESEADNNSDSEPDSEEEEEEDLEKPDVLDQLDCYLETFAMLTDELVKSRCKAPPVDVVKSTEEQPTQSKRIRNRRPSLLSTDAITLKTIQPSSEESIDSSVRTVTMQTLADPSDPRSHLKTLIHNCDLKRRDVCQLLIDLKGSQKQLEELQRTIHLKQGLVQSMLKNREVRADAKHKFQRKRSRLEEEYFKARTQLAQAESALLQKGAKLGAVEDVERCRALALRYEKKLKDVDSIKLIAEDSSRRLLDLENSLYSSQKQAEKLRKQMKRDEKKKLELEAAIKEDKRSIGRLEKQVSLMSISENRRLKAHASPPASDLEDAGAEHKDALRHEIRNLRKTRDYLVEQKCQLDKKRHKEKLSNDADERKLYECEEAVEAIDAAIEYKNELICGRIKFGSDRDNGMLIQRLNNLSEDEMRFLLFRYFQKVVDLRETSKKLELQAIELERECEAKTWRVQSLSHSLQQVRLEGERRLVIVQQQHEDKLSSVMRHFVDETSASSDNGNVGKWICQVAGTSRQVEEVRCKRESSRQHGKLVTKYREESREKNELIARVHELARYHSRRLPEVPISRHLQPATSAPSAKVTRQKNKLIIQQNKPKRA